jgi:hypothetical protein
VYGIRVYDHRLSYLQETEMELEGSKEEANDGEQEGTINQAGRPPPIILTSATNPIQLQKRLKGIVQGSLSSETPKTEAES